MTSGRSGPTLKELTQNQLVIFSGSQPVKRAGAGLRFTLRRGSREAEAGDALRPRRARRLSAIGRTEDARAALAKALALRPDMDWTLVDAMYPYSVSADAERLHDALRPGSQTAKHDCRTAPPCLHHLDGSRAYFSR